MLRSNFHFDLRRLGLLAMLVLALAACGTPATPVTPKPVEVVSAGTETALPQVTAPLPADTPAASQAEATPTAQAAQELPLPEKIIMR